LFIFTLLGTQCLPFGELATPIEVCAVCGELGGSNGHALNACRTCRTWRHASCDGWTSFTQLADSNWSYLMRQGFYPPSPPPE